jgi:hypothetical protein
MNLNAMKANALNEIDNSQQFSRVKEESGKLKGQGWNNDTQ